LLAAFVVIESRIAHPLVPLGVFRRRPVAAANGIAVMIGAALFSMFFFLSLYLQQVNGYSPLKAGFAFLPAALATLTGALAAPRLVTRVGVRRQLIIGPLLAGGGLAWLGQLSVGDGYVTHVFGALVLTGLGMGISFVPMTIAATADVPIHQAGLASGLINTSRQIGGAVGLAVMATVAAGASSPTAGYDRAFWISAAAMVIVAALAGALPGKPKPEQHVTSGEEIAEPTALVDA
jgi:predicted MFS family arabinose efflux permease